MMEAMARGYDAKSHILGVTYVEQGQLSGYVTYRDWPGYVFFSSFLYKATGVGYDTLLKLLEILLPLLRTVFIWYFATRLFQGKKEALLFSLLLLGFFWDPQTFDPSPQHFGILLMLPLVALCFSQGRLSTERRGLIIILFTTIVISHGLTSIMTALLILFWSLFSLSNRNWGYSRDIKGYNLPTLMVCMFLAYLMYEAGWVFEGAVQTVINMFREPFMMGEILTPDSPYQVSVVRRVYLFYILLLLWLFIIAARKEFWTKPRLERIFPLLCLIPLATTLIAYAGASGLPRFYAFSAPFIVWFLARESRNIGRIAVIGFTVVLLTLSFSIRYSAEHVIYVPKVEYAGARFIADKIPASDRGFIVTGYDPGPPGMANSLHQLLFESSPIVLWAPGDWIQFGVWSPRNERFVRYHNGDELLPAIYETYFGAKRDIVYTSGDYRIYSYGK